jgi:cupin fold WbuC family metalloprotein
MKIVDPATIATLVATAQAVPRRRVNFNLHERPGDPIQRFLNVAEPGTYSRPHRHAADRWELTAALCGAADLLVFAADGALLNRVRLGPQESLVEIGGGEWHAVSVLASGTVLLEVKPGPYDATSDKDFASWAPAEGDGAADACCRWMQVAAIGDRWPQGRRC